MVPSPGVDRHLVQHTGIATGLERRTATACSRRRCWEVFKRNVCEAAIVGVRGNVVPMLSTREYALEPVLCDSPSSLALTTLSLAVARLESTIRRPSMT